MWQRYVIVDTFIITSLQLSRKSNHIAEINGFEKIRRSGGKTHMNSECACMVKNRQEQKSDNEIRTRSKKTKRDIEIKRNRQG